jgi:hypothetical protein
MMPIIYTNANFILVRNMVVTTIFKQRDQSIFVDIWRNVSTQNLKDREIIRMLVSFVVNICGMANLPYSLFVEVLHIAFFS